MEEHAVGHAGQRVVQGLVLVLRLFDGKLIGRLLQRVRSLEHLASEQQRRQEDEDGARAELRETRHHEHAEQRERHVRHQELAEHADVELPDEAPRVLAVREVVVDRDEREVDAVADDRSEDHADRHPAVRAAARSRWRSPPTTARPLEHQALADHGAGDLRPDEQGLQERQLTAELALIARPEQRDQRRDGRRIEQRDRQLDREAQAERDTRHRRRDRHQVDGGDRSDPDQDLRVLERVRRVLHRDGDEGHDRQRHRELVEPQGERALRRDGWLRLRVRRDERLIHGHVPPPRRLPRRPRGAPASCASHRRSPCRRRRRSGCRRG